MRFDLAFLRRQVEALTEAYPELADDTSLLADTLEGETDVMDVLRHLVRQAQETKAIAEGLGEYTQELTGRKGRLDRRVEYLRALILNVMDVAGLPKANLPEATLSVRAGTARRVVDDAMLLPDCFVKIERKPDHAAIKEAGTDADIPGTHISNGAPSLTVRVA
jgi:hypothetical protein